MTSLVLVPARPNDLEAVAAIQFAANKEDVLFNSIFPKGASVTSMTHVTAQYEQMMDDDDTAHFMIVKETQHGEIVAFAIWHFVPPRNPVIVDEEMLQDTFSFPPDANADFGSRLLHASTRKRCEVVAGKFGWGHPYAFISAMSTHPQYRRGGAASKLLEWGIERADDVGIPVYVESTPIAIPLYQKFGFQTCDALPVELTGGKGTESLTHLCMCRSNM